MVNRMDAGSRDYIKINAAAWDQRHDGQMETARRGWSADVPRWGIFGVSEQTVHLLPSDLRGKDVLELGCGTAYVSAWLAWRGANVVGVDPAAGQLAIARRFQEEYGLPFPLVRASGEHVPLTAGSFDLLISEYGAAIWSDPYEWIPEASRLLRPGGELVFLGNSTLLMLCVPDEDETPATTELRRPQFDMHRFEWPDDPTIEFHLSHGDWVRLLRKHSFEILDLIELRPPPGATSPFGFVLAWWANQWPCEEVWRARRI
jgi:SAM-dependent methyltransferase